MSLHIHGHLFHMPRGQSDTLQRNLSPHLSPKSVLHLRAVHLQSRWTRQDIAPVSWSDLDLVRAHLSYRAVRQDAEPAAQLGCIRAGIDDTPSRQDRLSTGSS